jgi:hypothetical protein
VASTALELLTLARDRIASGWTQGAEARTDAGDPIDPWRPSATVWSLLGTIVASYEELSQRDLEFGLDQLAAALHRLSAFVDDDSLVRWNDAPGRTQADVLDALGHAIEIEASGPPLFVYSPN